MKNKILVAASSVAAVVAGSMALAHADSMFDIPTSTVSSFSANITDTLGNPGVLQILVIILALPALFWVIGRVKALFPKSR